MGFAAEMTNLGENCMDSFDDRVHFMGKNRFEVKKMKQSTHQFMNELKRNRKAMGRKLHAELQDFTDHLTDTVHKTLCGCKKERRQLHQEFKAGHNAFQRTAKAMANKRHAFFAQIKKSEQNFERKKPH